MILLAITIPDAALRAMIGRKAIPQICEELGPSFKLIPREDWVVLIKDSPIELFIGTALFETAAEAVLFKLQHCDDYVIEEVGGEREG